MRRGSPQVDIDAQASYRAYMKTAM